MNREHYLSKRLRRQIQAPVDRRGEQENGTDADIFSSTTGAGKDKQTSAVNAPKRDAGTEPDIKSGAR